MLKNVRKSENVQVTGFGLVKNATNYKLAKLMKPVII